MAQNITLMGASYSAVPAVTLPKTGGGTASFTDVSDTTATAADVASGTYFYTAAGVRTEGTRSGGGGGSTYDIVVRCSISSFPNTVANYSVISADIDAIIAKIQNNDYVSGILYYTGYNSNEEEYRYDNYKLGYIHAYEDASAMEVRFWTFKTVSPYYATKTMVIGADGTISYVN